MLTKLGLGRRRENQFRQLFALLQTGRQLLPAYRAVLLVFFPTRTRQVSPHDALDGQYFYLLYQHAPPGQLFGVAAERFGVSGHIVAD